jgi:hypothetical protein
MASESCNKDSAITQNDSNQTSAGPAVPQNNSDQAPAALEIPQNDSDQASAPPANFVVVSVYESKREMTLHRLSSATTFLCGRCNREKKAKLVATYRKKWSDLRCNGCYGKLLSEK